MPQGSWLGPLSFIVLVDDLVAGPTLYKYVDHIICCESLSSTSQVSDIDSHIKCLLSWTTQNFMKINYSKTKEMLLDSLSKLNIPHLVINYSSIKSVCGFKLFGVYISNDMSWNLHVDYICATNGLSVLVFLLTFLLPTDQLLFGIPPSSDQFLNTAQLFGTTAL